MNLKYQVSKSPLYILFEHMNDELHLNERVYLNELHLKELHLMKEFQNLQIILQC